MRSRFAETEAGVRTLSADTRARRPLQQSDHPWRGLSLMRAKQACPALLLAKSRGRLGLGWDLLCSSPGTFVDLGGAGLGIGKAIVARLCAAGLDSRAPGDGVVLVALLDRARGAIWRPSLGAWQR